MMIDFKFSSNFLYALAVSTGLASCFSYSYVANNAAYTGKNDITTSHKDQILSVLSDCTQQSVELNKNTGVITIRYQLDPSQSKALQNINASAPEPIRFDIGANEPMYNTIFNTTAMRHHHGVANDARLSPPESVLVPSPGTLLGLVGLGTLLLVRRYRDRN